jgi:retron-type reverse transcriptase
MFGYGSHWSIAAKPDLPRRQMVWGNPFYIPPLAKVMTVDNALAAYERLKAKGGPAAGVDRVRYEDVSRAEVAACFCLLVPIILAGDYRPQPVRVVEIAKAGGGTRALRLQVILDRVVAKMIYEAVVEYLDRLFVPWSYGFRPRKSAWHLLADMKLGVEKYGLPVLTHDDIRKAFDNVPVEPLLEVLGDVLPDHHHWELIAAIVRKVDAAGRGVTTGIDQGCALSPLLLNLYLHSCSDTLLTQEATTPSWKFRYADNLGHLTRDAHEGTHSLDEVRRHLGRAGLTLKGYDPEKPDEPLGLPVDLRTGSSPLLGFDLSILEGSLLLEVRDKVWKALATELETAHTHPDPPGRARGVIQGLVSAIGPALDRRLPSTTRRITRHLREANFPRIIPAETLSWWTKGSLESWLRVLDKTRNPGGQ